jgi:hypothetical protein
MEPHEVLNLPPDGYTLEQLRHNYKLLAKQLHPDRRTCSQAVATSMFQVLTEAYRELLGRLERRGREGGDFARLRADFRSHIEDTTTATAQKEGASGKFDLDRFNGVFTQNRISDPVVDGGYGDWMRENDPDDPASKRRAAALILRARPDEPEPTAIGARACVAYSVLGETDVVDYSRSDVVAGSRAVLFSDYRLAHTTERLATDKEFAEAAERSLREPRTVEALKKHRAEVSYAMTEQQAEEARRRKRERDLAERRRMDALDAYDRMVEEVHARTSRLLM